MKITDNIFYIGVDDRKIDLFEAQYVVPNGMSYNSYVILDEKIAVLDTVDAGFTREWLENLESVLCGRQPDYLVIHHMEPDHSANIASFIEHYPSTTIVATAKAFTMIENFFGDLKAKQLTVENGSTLSLGKHELQFLSAPMVHWPEVIFSYERNEKILFSADAFGKFGTLDTNELWDDEARRYYFGIVGKYGTQVQNVLTRATEFEIKMICPLHGPFLSDKVDYYIEKYLVWSSYQPEDEGILIAYTSIYGNTKRAAMALAEKLRSGGCPTVKVLDLARVDWSHAVAEAFRYSKLVLATTTYSSNIFPAMRHFIDHLIERNYKNRTVGFIENGSWAPTATKIMHTLFEKSCGITFISSTCTIRSALNSDSTTALDSMAKELCYEYREHSNND